MNMTQRFHHLVVGAVVSTSLLTTMPLLAQEPAVPAAPAEEEFFDFDEGESDALTISDPLEGMNRAFFGFNDKFYRYAAKPVARGLRILPVPVRQSMANFFNNLGAPVSAASALLQGDVRNAGTELGRFVLNTTAGLAGFLDPATDVGLIQDEEDLGQTLARYGVGHGVYLVLPFLGSTSVRDAIGSTATSQLNPLYEELEPGQIAAINLVQAEVALSLDADTYEAFYDTAIDPYSFFRSAWLQNRQGKIDQ
ncbi:MAG: VacJ family lipoprotein [Pseudomonadota bacterium]